MPKIVETKVVEKVVPVPVNLVRETAVEVPKVGSHGFSMVFANVFACFSCVLGGHLSKCDVVPICFYSS